MRNGIGGDHKGNQSPVAGRQVLAIRNIDYFLLQFNDKGRIDKKEWERGMRLGMELLPSLHDEHEAGHRCSASFCEETLRTRVQVEAESEGGGCNRGGDIKVRSRV